jgi:hypothetical protein
MHGGVVNHRFSDILNGCVEQRNIDDDLMELA